MDVTVEDSEKGSDVWIRIVEGILEKQADAGGCWERGPKRSLHDCTHTVYKNHQQKGKFIY